MSGPSPGLLEWANEEASDIEYLYTLDNGTKVKTKLMGPAKEAVVRALAMAVHTREQAARLDEAREMHAVLGNHAFDATRHHCCKRIAALAHPASLREATARQAAEPKGETACGTAETAGISTSVDIHPTAKSALRTGELLSEWNQLSPDSQAKVGKWFNLASEHLQKILDEPAAEPQYADEIKPPCPECGCEELDKAGMYKCECPARKPAEPPRQPTPSSGLASEHVEQHVPKAEHVHTPGNYPECCSCAEWKCTWNGIHRPSECERQWKEHVKASQVAPK